MNAPMLSEEAERQCVIDGDHATLIKCHLKLVVRMARQYAGYGCDPDEMFAEGCLGLQKAVLKYRLDKETRFASYAMWWIKTQMLEFAMRNHSQVKIGTTAAQKTLFFAKGKIMEGTPQDVAKRFGVGALEVIEMRQRLQRDTSLNAPIRGHVESDEPGELIQILIDDSPNPEEVLAEKQEREHVNASLAFHMEKLSERERDIILQRSADDPASLQDLSDKYGVSRERIRQIETRSLEKLREYMGATPNDNQPVTVNAKRRQSLKQASIPRAKVTANTHHRDYARAMRAKKAA
jgi:RNA polymerase sigma-32 factor